MIDSSRTSVTLGLVQHRCTLDPDENMRKAVRGVRDAAARGAQIVCLQELFRTQYFCQVEDHAFFDLAEPIPGPTTEALVARSRAELGRRRSSRSLFEKRGGGRVSQHRRRHRRRRPLLGHVPQDAHPGRPALLREVLLHARRPRLPQLRHRASAGSASLVCWDQWYPEAARLTALQRRRDPLLPDGDRLASRRRRPSTARQQQSAWETIQRATRSPTASTSARSTASATRATGRRRHRVLGRQLRRRPRRPDPGEGAATDEEVLIVDRATWARWTCSRTLALPPRPPDRRVPGHHEAVSRLRTESP